MGYLDNDDSYKLCASSPEGAVVLPGPSCRFAPEGADRGATVSGGIAGRLPSAIVAKLSASTKTDGMVRCDGTLASSHFGVPNLFQGMRVDSATELYQTPNRDYSPVLGRWMEQDPAGYIDGTNLYQADDSTPAAEADPYGTDPVAIFGADYDPQPKGTTGWDYNITYGFTAAAIGDSVYQRVKTRVTLWRGGSAIGVYSSDIREVSPISAADAKKSFGYSVDQVHGDVFGLGMANFLRQKHPCHVTVVDTFEANVFANVKVKLRKNGEDSDVPYDPNVHGGGRNITNAQLAAAGNQINGQQIRDYTSYTRADGTSEDTGGFHPGYGYFNAIDNSGKVVDIFPGAGPLQPPAGLFSFSHIDTMDFDLDEAGNVTNSHGSIRFSGVPNDVAAKLHRQT